MIWRFFRHCRNLKEPSEHRLQERWFLQPFEHVAGVSGKFGKPNEVFVE